MKLITVAVKSTSADLQVQEDLLNYVSLKVRPQNYTDNHVTFYTGRENKVSDTGL